MMNTSVPNSPNDVYSLDLKLHMIDRDYDLEICAACSAERAGERASSFRRAQRLQEDMAPLLDQHLELTGRIWQRRVDLYQVRYDDVPAALWELYEAEADEAAFSAEYAEFCQQAEREVRGLVWSG